MKKALVSSVAAAVFAVAGAPYAMGMAAESHYRGLVDSTNRQAGASPLRLRVESYERGWLSSRVRVRAEIIDPDLLAAYRELFGPAADGTFHYTESLYHGPLPLGGGAGLRPALATIQSDLGSLALAPGVSLAGDARSRVGFDGAVSGEMTIEPVDFSTDATQLHWSGASLSYRVGADLDTVSAQGEVASLRFASTEERSSFEGLRMRIDQHEGPEGVALGSGEITLDRAEVHNPIADYRLAELGARYDMRAEGSTVRWEVGWDLKELRTVDGVYGPGQLVAHLTGLDAAALARVEKRLGELRREAESVERAESSMTEILASDLPGLLAGKPELVVSRLELATPQGQLSGHARVSLGRYDQAMAKNPLRLLGGLTAQAHLQIPRALARGNPQVGSLAAGGWLAETNDTYVLDAEYDAGRATINGTTLPMRFQ